MDESMRQEMEILRLESGNMKCFECGSPYPQWISVSYGIWICLNCAGVHRSMGVHLSFVRSVTMDVLKPDELTRMQVGGNDKARAFFNLSLPQNSMTLKYKSEQAALYRQQIMRESGLPPTVEYSPVESVDYSVRTVPPDKKYLDEVKDSMMTGWKRLAEGTARFVSDVPNMAREASSKLSQAIDKARNSDWNNHY